MVIKMADGMVVASVLVLAAVFIVLPEDSMVLVWNVCQMQSFL